MRTLLPCFFVVSLALTITVIGAEGHQGIPAKATKTVYSAHPALQQVDVSEKAETAVAKGVTPSERFEAVRILAVSGYTRKSTLALAEVACSRSVGETTRNYAAMGLRNFTRSLPEELKTTTRKRLRDVIKREKGDVPDGIIRLLIAWNDAPFIEEALSKQLNGHTMEIEVLAALPGKENCDKLWQLYQTSPKGYKSAYYNRKASIGRALANKDDRRGIDILVDLLPANHAPGPQYRHNVFAFLAQRLDKDFGYKAVNYDPALEEAIPAMIEWWQKNRETFAMDREKEKDY